MTERDFDRRLQLLEDQNKKLKEDVHDLQAGIVSSSRDISTLDKLVKELRTEVIMLNGMMGQFRSDITEIVALCENAWGKANKSGSKIITPN